MEVDPEGVCISLQGTAICEEGIIVLDGLAGSCFKIHQPRVLNSQSPILTWSQLSQDQLSQELHISCLK